MNGFKIGDEVEFLRQAVGYPTKKMKGIIHSFNYKKDNYDKPHYLAHIKADCEYGSDLPYNHTINIEGLKTTI